MFLMILFVYFERASMYVFYVPTYISTYCKTWLGFFLLLFWLSARVVNSGQTYEYFWLGWHTSSVLRFNYALFFSPPPFSFSKESKDQLKNASNTLYNSLYMSRNIIYTLLFFLTLETFLLCIKLVTYQ